MTFFQRKLDSVYIGLPGVKGIADDMVVYGTTESEHDWNLINFCETTRKNGLRLNKAKIQFKKKEVSFFGHSLEHYRDISRPKEDSIHYGYEIPQR